MYVRGPVLQYEELVKKLDSYRNLEVPNDPEQAFMARIEARSYLQSYFRIHGIELKFDNTQRVKGKDEV